MSRTAAKYLGLFGHFVSLAIVRELEFRTNFVIQQFRTLFWQLLRYVSMLIVANRFGEVAGWDKRMLLVLVSTAEIMNCVLGMLAKRSFHQLPEDINTGKLDLYLTKPVSPLFLASLTQFRLDRAIALVITVGVIIYLTPTVSATTVVLYVLLVAIAVAAFYYLWLFFISLNFHVGRLYDISPLLDNLWGQADYPIQTYRQFNPILFALLIPFLVLSTVPASLLVDRFDMTLTIVFFAIAATIIIGSHRFWHYSLDRYTSASS